MTAPPSEFPHRRFNPLTREWVLVSPHRTQRPWQGQVEAAAVHDQPAYDPSCYLCPGNARAGGIRNPSYSSTFVFDNDYPALIPGLHQSQHPQNRLMIAQAEEGICRVGCFSPAHNLAMSKMSKEEIALVIAMWCEQFADLGALDFINHVQIFENRGAMMGASNPHPHCQIWGTSSLPDEPAKEQAAMRDYLRENDRCLLCEYIQLERANGARVVLNNDHFLVLVPFWAIWPFETLVLPVRHLPDLVHMTDPERDGLADVLARLTRCYDRVFNSPFPYSMGFHQQPTDAALHPEWHLHMHFYPPLLRSAGIRKFMVGFELLGTPQRDITAETAAERLRELCESV